MNRPEEPAGEMTPIESLRAELAGSKPSNPKDAVGCTKPPLSCLPLPPLMEAAVGMFEGARKYGRHNYRDVGVRHSIYFDGTIRHLFAWWEGEDIDPDSGIHHVSKAIASLLVLRDSMLRGNDTDDRPPRAPEGWIAALQPAVDAIRERHPDPVPAHLETDRSSSEADPSTTE